MSYKLLSWHIEKIEDLVMIGSPLELPVFLFALATESLRSHSISFFERD